MEAGGRREEEGKEKPAHCGHFVNGADAKEGVGGRGRVKGKTERGLSRARAILSLLTLTTLTLFALCLSLSCFPPPSLH